ncbi:MAG TPA: phosphatidylserine decarboxylase [Thermoplasmata archaeon]|nr:phosphatidylserine decarboxylase [Thermoplasmata archaeon]
MFAPGAVRWIGPPLALGTLLAALAAARVIPDPILGGVVAALALAVATFLAVFFRDPARVPAAGIVSAADGRVRAVERSGDRLLVSVFMNVYDVHVNRMPLDATVESMEAAGAGYRPAYRSDAAGNVRRHYRLSTGIGPVEVVQITGAVARRCVPFVAVGDRVAKGAPFGMIVLGSRVDVWLPAARVVATVAPGDRVRAGASPIAREAA